MPMRAAPPPAQYVSPPPVTLLLIAFLLVFFFLGIFFVIFCKYCIQSLWHNRRITQAGAPLGPDGNPAADMPPGIDPKIIDSFPTFTYSSVKDYRKEKYGLECAICLVEFEDESLLRLLTSCSHVFHQECIDLWMESHKTCPVCRQALDSLPPPPSTSPYSSVPGGGSSVDDDENFQEEFDRDDDDEQVRDDTHHHSITIVHDDEVVIDNTNDDLTNNRGEGGASVDHISNHNNHQQGNTSLHKYVVTTLNTKNNNHYHCNNNNNNDSNNNSNRSSVIREEEEKFPRSHSTGHSIVKIREDPEDRFTLRIPPHVRAKIIRGHTVTKSCTTFGEHKNKTTSGNRCSSGLSQV
ncbi:unnamed protein product [Cuscuta epithymum]|uniref:RING-type E3 ubiquitin transferase n=1 Tax=Cuscuta epithymum TaxID=186058 RepID=A0AAV0BY75_9ASTE|nr:unnamed protein product [Cuscuta epithymum]